MARRLRAEGVPGNGRHDGDGNLIVSAHIAPVQTGKGPSPASDQVRFIFSFAFGGARL